MKGVMGVNEARGWFQERNVSFCSTTPVSSQHKSATEICESSKLLQSWESVLRHRVPWWTSGSVLQVHAWAREQGLELRPEKDETRNGEQPWHCGLSSAQEAAPRKRRFYQILWLGMQPPCRQDNKRISTNCTCSSHGYDIFPIHNQRNTSRMLPCGSLSDKLSLNRCRNLISLLLDSLEHGVAQPYGVT